MNQPACQLSITGVTAGFRIRSTRLMLWDTVGTPASIFGDGAEVSGGQLRAVSVDSPAPATSIESADEARGSPVVIHGEPPCSPWFEP